MKRWFDLLLVIAAVLTLAFLLLPLGALFLRTSPGQVIDQLRDEVAIDALLVSLRTSAAAHALILVVGTPAAYLLATRAFRGRRLAVVLLELPLVLPPVVAGIALLAAFGRLGLIGKELSALGISIPFTQAAVVLAVVFVASPFYIRQAVASFESVDHDLIDAARTLGMSRFKVFHRIVLPLALGGLGAGSALAFARGLGEFGATIIFAGSLQGVTQTLPLAIYGRLDQDFDAAVSIGVLLVIVSAAILVAVRTLPSWRSLSSTSPLISAVSLSN